MGILIVVTVGLVALVGLAASMADSAEGAMQAQAAIQAAEAARAASVATAMQSAALGLLGIVVVVLLLVVLWLMRRDARRQDDPAGRWVSGPNARWARMEPTHRGQLWQGMDPERMLTMAMLERMLARLGTDAPRALPPAAGPDVTDDAAEVEPWWR